MQQHARACQRSRYRASADYGAHVVIDHGGERWEYLQLADILRARVSEGEYPPGAKIPPLLDLQAEFGLSSMTVRRAVGVLVDEGLLVRVPGRGTYVRRELVSVLCQTWNLPCLLIHRYHRRVTTQGNRRAVPSRR